MCALPLYLSVLILFRILQYWQPLRAKVGMLQIINHTVVHWDDLSWFKVENQKKTNAVTVIDTCHLLKMSYFYRAVFLLRGALMLHNYHACSFSVTHVKAMCTQAQYKAFRIKSAFMYVLVLQHKTSVIKSWMTVRYKSDTTSDIYQSWCLPVHLL